MCAKARITLLCASLLMLVATAVVDADVVGTKKKGLKGRYLVLEDGVNLADYKGALVILDPAEITADKERAVDTESVRVTSDEMLKDKLGGLRFFGNMVAQPPLQIPEDTKILRVTTKLTLQYGSEAMRFWVGGGAGKSKLHIRVDVVDALSGSPVAYFNGYGTGAGLMSMSGGGIQFMARDDLQENYDELTKLIAQKVGVPAPTS